MDRAPEQGDCVWRKLCTGQLEFLAEADGHISPIYLEGLRTIHFDRLCLPDPIKIQEKLHRRLSGWQLVVGDWATIDDAQWFEYLANRRLPVSSRLRSSSEIDSSPEPDLFHDYFGHVPYIAISNTADIYRVMGEKFCLADAERKTMIAKFYYFAIELGLIMEGDRVQLFGAGILSSPRYSRKILALVKNDSPMPIMRHRADLDRILEADVSPTGEPKDVFVFQCLNHMVELLAKI